MEKKERKTMSLGVVQKTLMAKPKLPFGLKNRSTRLLGVIQEKLMANPSFPVGEPM